MIREDKDFRLNKHILCGWINKLNKKRCCVKIHGFIIIVII